MKETKGKILMILIISLIALLCAGRGTLAVTPLKADKESIDVSLNGVKNVYVSGGTGTTTYTSSDSTIAEVNDKGQVTGKKIGTAKITATKGEESVIINANVIYNQIQDFMEKFIYLQEHMKPKIVQQKLKIIMAVKLKMQMLLGRVAIQM